MRIIGGHLKGRKILNPIDKSTRPLKDLVRESIFNIIEHSKIINIKLKNINVIDLYSGVGSFGLECLSRGAKKIYFFEKYSPSIKILKKNIEVLECKNKCEIIEDDVKNIERYSKILMKQFNLIFLDPPFLDQNINLILDKICKMKILNEDSCIIIHRNKKTKEKFTDKIEILRSEVYGSSKIFFASIAY